MLVAILMIYYAINKINRNFNTREAIYQRGEMKVKTYMKKISLKLVLTVESLD